MMSDSKRVNFTQPVLSEEHIKHVRRFLGWDISAEAWAKQQAYVAYKDWSHAKFPPPASRRTPADKAEDQEV